MARLSPILSESYPHKATPVSLLLVASFGIAVIAGDQLLKLWCAAKLFPHQRVAVLGQWFLLTRNYNRGLAYGSFSSIPNGSIEPYTRYFPTLVFVLLLAIALPRLRWGTTSEKVGFILLLAGGFSNLWSQWNAEWVLDTFLIPNGWGNFMPFNLADAALCFGACLLFSVQLHALFVAKARGTYLK